MGPFDLVGVNLHFRGLKILYSQMSLGRQRLAQGVRLTKEVVLSAVNFIEDLLYMVFLQVHPLHLSF
jgi:hypothetical protein